MTKPSMLLLAALATLTVGTAQAAQSDDACASLMEARANLVGAILTKFDVRRSEYSYGYNYSNSYGPNFETKSLTSEARRRRRIEIFTDNDPGAGTASREV